MGIGSLQEINLQNVITNYPETSSVLLTLIEVNGILIHVLQTFYKYTAEIVLHQ